MGKFVGISVVLISKLWLQYDTLLKYLDTDTESMPYFILIKKQKKQN